jgi:Lrp/AsnC family transcriptional regulator, regulator for asnA, asnC and gidA
MWDLYLVFWSKNIFQFNEIFTEINNKYSYYFSKKAIIANTKVLQFMRKHLALNKKDMDFSKIEWAGEISEAKVDEIDIKILLAIALNARMPDTQIAKKLKISRKVVAYRIKHLIQERIIYSFKPFLNGGLLGYKTYKLFITLQSLTKEKEHSLMTYLQHHPNVIEVVYCIGSWELEIDIESSSIDINHNIIRELRSKFTDVIREVDVMHVYKTHKYLYIAPGLVDIS